MIDGIPAAGAPSQPAGRAEGSIGGRELFVRSARKDGRTLAILRTIDNGVSCVVQAEVFPHGAGATQPTSVGPYTFADVHQATAFVNDAVEALIVLGCDVD